MDQLDKAFAELKRTTALNVGIKEFEKANDAFHLALLETVNQRALEDVEDDDESITADEAIAREQLEADNAFPTGRARFASNNSGMWLEHEWESETDGNTVWVPVPVEQVVYEPKMKCGE
jgi:hypothetical protein